jgi:hypothetical protein
VTINRRLADVCVAAVLLVLALGSVALHTDGYTKVSPVDELQHIDYLYRAPFPPAYADKVGQDAMREQACRGLDFVGEGERVCTTKDIYDPATYQERGYSTGSVNSPVYYTLTKLVAVPLKAVAGFDSLVTAGRMVGGLWLGLGLVITYLTAVRRGVRRSSAAAVLALLAASPALLFPSSTISPDSMGLLAGAVVLASLTWWEHRRTVLAAVGFILAAVLVTLVKMTFILPVGAAALTLLITSRAAGESPHWLKRFATKDVALAAGASVAALGAALAWMVVQASRAQMDPEALPDLATRFLVPSFPWHGLLDSGVILVTPLSSPWALVGDPSQMNFTTALPSAVLGAGIIAAGLLRAAPKPHLPLATATLVVAVLGGLGLVIVNYVTSDSYFQLPSRYGSSQVAAMAVSTAAVVRGRRAAIAVGLVAVVALVISLVRLTGLT